jgi:hypothetical protein
MLRAVRQVEPLTMNGKSNTYIFYDPFALRYRRVNGTFCEFIKIQQRPLQLRPEEPLPPDLLPPTNLPLPLRLPPRNPSPDPLPLDEGALKDRSTLGDDP